ncbi:MAG: tetratricopeptide repeat protein [Cyanobacteriota bacterium]|nr:tetratricopeptide repeat protein [Cyanobacteriota bacterium]
MPKQWVFIILSLSTALWSFAGRGTALAQDDLEGGFEFPNPAFWTEQCLFLGGEELYEEALSACERAIALQPEAENREVWQARSYSLFQLERYGEAVVSYNRLLRLTPRDSLAWTNQCVALYRLERYEDAIASCEQALLANGNWGIGSPALAWYHRGRTLQASGSEQETVEEALIFFQRALESYDRALELDPDEGLIVAGRCEVLSVLVDGGRVEEGCDLEEAIASYEIAAANAPNDVDLWKNQALALERLGRDEKALVSYARALAIRPEYSLVLAQQCAVLNRLGNYEEALTACEGALAGDGEWGDRNPAFAWSQSSRAHVGLEQYEEALAAAERAVTIAPNFSEAWNNRGVSLWHLNRFEEALAATQRAVAIAPDYAIALFNTGRSLSSLDRYDEAMEFYNRAIAAYDVRPPQPLSCQELRSDIADIRSPVRKICASLWNHKGVAHIQLQEYSEAKQGLQIATELDPDFFEAWYNLGIALVSLNENEAALEVYRQADRLRPNRIDILMVRGTLLEKLERYEDAIAIYDVILSLDPQYIPARQNRARAIAILLERQLNPSSQ